MFENVLVKYKLGIYLCLMGDKRYYYTSHNKESILLVKR
jgi:hypothetical protein